MGKAGYGNHTDDAKDPADPKQADRAKSPDKPRAGDLPPAAGPHDKPSLTNPDATPGTGVLPAPGEKNGTGSTSG